MWDYAEANRVATISSVTSNRCIFCRHELIRIPSAKFESGNKVLLTQASVCPACGWWSVYRVHQGEFERTAGVAEGYSATIGSLRELDLADVSVPLAEVRQYLLAKQDSMYSVHPRVFEDVVASVFSDLGWHVRVTAYSGDDGIDMVLNGTGGLTIGVQVKRYRRERRIEAEQIRSLAGALLLDGHTKGVFVSTSAYRKGARNTAQRYAAIGRPIQLIDAERFLDELGVAQIASFTLTRDRIADYILRPGLHVGTGVHTEFSPGEDLRARPIVLQAFAKGEW